MLMEMGLESATNYTTLAHPKLVVQNPKTEGLLLLLPIFVSSLGLDIHLL